MLKLVLDGGNTDHYQILNVGGADIDGPQRYLFD